MPKGAMFPVVCTAPLSKEILTRFIEQRGVEERHWFMVIVDSIDDYYDEVSEAPVENDIDPASPFIGKTIEECHQLLLKLAEGTESEIMPEYFAILDERSAEDDTVQLVYPELNDDYEIVGYPTVRASFQVSASALMCYHSGHSSIGEDLELAEDEDDKIYRGQFSARRLRKNKAEGEKMD